MTLRYETTYKLKPGDDLGDPIFWNSRLQDIDLRLNAAEGQFAKFDAGSQSIIDAGINRINTTLQPIITAAQNQVNDLAGQVASLQAQVLTDQGNLTAQLNSLLAQAQTLVANLESLGSIDGGTF